jgi:mRNA-degrading endonuclease toxin of MazEF toxin-antitoxin module
MPPNSRTHFFSAWRRQCSDSEDELAVGVHTFPPSASVPEHVQEPAPKPEHQAALSLPDDSTDGVVAHEDQDMRPVLPASAAAVDPLPVLAAAPAALDPRVRAAALQAVAQALTKLQRIAAVSSRVSVQETRSMHEAGLGRHRQEIEHQVLQLVQQLADQEEVLLVGT